MSYIPLIRAVGTALLLGSLQASAMADDASDCQQLLGERQLAACSRIIESTKVDRSVLAYAYTVRGNSRVRAHNLDGAITDYDKTIELAPTYAYAYTVRGDAKNQQDNLEGALSDLNRSIELDPKYAYSFDVRGAIRERIGDLDSAIADYSRAIELDHTIPMAYFHRAAAKEKNGDRSGANSDYEHLLTQFNHLIEKTPEHGVLYLHRGWVRYSMDDTDGAMTDFNQAIEHDPRNVQALNARGRIRLMNGEPALAAEDLSRSFELETDTEVALLLYIARVRSGAGAHDELAANFKKIDLLRWPAPVAALYLDRYPVQALHTLATDTRPARRNKACGANFYLAEWYVINNDTSRALPLLRAAAKLCDPHSFGRDGARAELKRLEPEDGAHKK